MNRADRDYEKLKAFADQLRKENKKLREQMEKIVFERNENIVSKRIYETDIRNLKASHARELEQTRAVFAMERAVYTQRSEELWRLREDTERMTRVISDLQRQLEIVNASQKREPQLIKQYDGIRKIYLDD